MTQNNDQTKKLLSYLRPYLGPIILTLTAIIAARAATTVEPFYLKQIIDFIIARTGQAAITDPDLLRLLVIYFALRIAAFIFEFLRDYVFAPVEMGVGRNIARDLFNHLLHLPLGYHHDQKTGTLARRISRGAQSINFILDFLVSSILPTLFELIFVTALLLRFYPLYFSLITLATVLAYAAFTILTTELRQRYRLAANVAEDESSGVQIETIYNIETVKYFGNEQFQRKKFLDRLNEWYRASVRSNQLFGAISAGQSLILLLGFGLIIYLAVRQALAGILTVGDLVLLTTYVVRLSVPISTLGFVYRRIKDGLTDISEMMKMLQVRPDLAAGTANRTIAKPKGKVELCHINFQYGRRTVLQDLTLLALPGQRVAIVGPSGSGKSTLVKLLFRLYRPQGGQINLDGVDLQAIFTNQLYDLVALVPQETVLFNDTIAENIRFGKPGASDREVATAARLANLSDLIERLPEGTDTIVGERGVKLSGGEKQRVAIARAIIKNPHILVFDEATSNLDAESEREVLKSIRQVSQGRTTITIAHRLPTITDSDVIYVMDRGRIVESGTHPELLRRGGLYSRLWRAYEREHAEINQT
ncbi:MAG: ABC transporter transmembrane domain-containing protein [Patescibacteria group bacterium]|mgnify:CR=1 FL=1